MKRLVVGHDLTPRSTDALGRAIRLAATHGAAIRIVHAAPADSNDGPSTHRRVRTEAQIMAEELSKPFVQISARIASRDPASAITKAAERFDADLILIGAHGEPRLRDAIFGTTAMHLAQDCDRPILVVQTPHDQPYAKVMIAVDDESSAEAILLATARLVPDAELLVVHAFEPTIIESLFRPGAVSATKSDRKRELEALAARILPVAGDQRCHVLPREGQVMEVLMQAWLELGPDLLVMGVHKGRGLARLLGGNLADPVLLACTSDVLLVPLD